MIVKKDVGSNFYVGVNPIQSSSGSSATITTLSKLGITATNVSTQTLVDAVVAKNLPIGSIVVGGVELTDFPDAGIVNAEIMFTVQDSTLGVKVYDIKLTSIDVAPYEWIAGCTSVSTRVSWVTITSQYTTMPTPSVDYDDKTVQYVGESDGTYNRGSFYHCEKIGSSYSWVILQVNSAATILSSVSGYDATKTQVLKNVNGTFTWVDA